MVTDNDNDRHVRTEVGMPHPRVQRQKKRPNNPPSSLSNTMPIARKSVFERPTIAHRVYLEVHGLEEGIVAIELGQDPVFIGRSPDCDVHLPLANISREHAQIVYRNDEHYLEDLNSTNGVYVNGIRVKKCVLRNNDQIEIGEARIHFVEEKTVGRPS